VSPPCPRPGRVRCGTRRAPAELGGFALLLTWLGLGRRRASRGFHRPRLVSHLHIKLSARPGGKAALNLPRPGCQSNPRLTRNLDQWSRRGPVTNLRPYGHGQPTVLTTLENKNSERGPPAQRVEQCPPWVDQWCSWWQLLWRRVAEGGTSPPFSLLDGSPQFRWKLPRGSSRIRRACRIGLSRPRGHVLCGVVGWSCPSLLQPPNEICAPVWATTRVSRALGYQGESNTERS